MKTRSCNPSLKITESFSPGLPVLRPHLRVDLLLGLLLGVRLLEVAVAALVRVQNLQETLVFVRLPGEPGLGEKLQFRNQSYILS